MAGYQAPAAGLFITHDLSPRIKRHFRRLVAETESLVQWRIVHSPDLDPRPITKIPHADPVTVMPSRFSRAAGSGGVGGGYLDVVFIPCMLALRARHVWVMEYEVDFSGNWRDLFAQFSGVNSDVLTSTLNREPDCPNWHGWPESAAPDWIDRGDFVRGFHPLLRLSRRFAHRYAVMMADARWNGHYEFTIPTAAVASGSSIQDLGAGGEFSSDGREANYLNTPTTPGLAPGTFVWRPTRGAYYHEEPGSFAEANRLHHPVKPDAAACDEKTSEQSP